MLNTVEGVYEDGSIELAERPAGVDRAKVYVTFVAEGPAVAGAETVEQWLAFLREGLALGGPPYPQREELYDRAG